MTMPGPVADIGLTPQVVLLIFVTWLGVLAGVAFGAGGLAVAIVGPRRMSAVLVPGAVTLVVVLALSFIGRQTITPILLLAAMGSALLVAVAQRAVLPYRDDIDRALASGPWFVIAGIVAGIVTGAIIGGIAAAFIGPPSLLPLLAILGSVFGALRGGAMGRRTASKPPGASED